MSELQRVADLLNKALTKKDLPEKTVSFINTVNETLRNPGETGYEVVVNKYTRAVYYPDGSYWYEKKTFQVALLDLSKPETWDTEYGYEYVAYEVDPERSKVTYLGEGPGQ